MKKLILLFAIILVVSSVNAQTPKIPTPEELAKKNIDEMDTRLKLTGTQKSIIYNYVFDLAKQQVALIKLQQAGTFQNEDGTKYFLAQNEIDRKIKNVLKAEQLPEYKLLVEERLNGKDTKKKKKKRKGEEEEVVVGIEGLRSEGDVRP